MGNKDNKYIGLIGDLLGILKRNIICKLGKCTVMCSKNFGH